jgi:putative FmdB family regulatory protein
MGTALMYRCNDCGAEFEALTTNTDPETGDEVDVCPECGSDDWFEGDDEE